jgi:hypothetical protein
LANTRKPLLGIEYLRKIDFISENNGAMLGPDRRLKIDGRTCHPSNGGTEMTDLHVTQNFIGIRDAIREQEDAAGGRLASSQNGSRPAPMVSLT